MKPIVIYGSGGHAREVAEIVMHAHREQGRPGLLGFLDDRHERKGDLVLGHEVLGGFSWLADHLGEFDLVVAIGDNSVRQRIADRALELGATFGSAVSPLAHFSPACQIGPGAMIFPRVTVSTNVVIGAHVILGVHSSVSHDCRVGDFSFLCPGARLTGNVTLGNRVMIGTNACVIPGKSIGRKTIVGAGAAVVDNLPEDVVAVGVPARVKAGK